MILLAFKIYTEKENNISKYVNIINFHSKPKMSISRNNTNKKPVTCIFQHTKSHNLLAGNYYNYIQKLLLLVFR